MVSLSNHISIAELYPIHNRKATLFTKKYASPPKSTPKPQKMKKAAPAND